MGEGGGGREGRRPGGREDDLHREKGGDASVGRGDGGLGVQWLGLPRMDGLTGTSLRYHLPGDLHGGRVMIGRL